jgi:hypothetical protein
MNYVFGNAIVGLPSLIGVILGLKLYVDGFRFAIYPAILLVVPLILLVIAKSIMHKFPMLARAFIEVWIASAIAVTGFATAFVTWITLDSPISQLFKTSGLNADQIKAISAAFVAAVSTYVALAWTKDIGDAKGFFWPSTQFKNAMGGAFPRLQPPQPNGGVVYQACFMDTVAGYGNIGWGFCARKKRADILARPPAAPPAQQ